MASRDRFMHAGLPDKSSMQETVFFVNGPRLFS